MNNLDAPQHLDDIVIPDIEITPGWAVSEVETIEDCDDAFAYLSAAVAQIDYQIEMHLLRMPADQDAEWAARARCALKYKKAALGMISNKRTSIRRRENQAVQRERDRVLLDHIKAIVPAITFAEWVRTSGVDRFDEAAAA